MKKWIRMTRQSISGSTHFHLAVSLVKERHTTLEFDGSDELSESRINRVNNMKEGCGRSRNYPQAMQAGGSGDSRSFKGEK